MWLGVSGNSRIVGAIGAGGAGGAGGYVEGIVVDGSAGADSVGAGLGSRGGDGPDGE